MAKTAVLAILFLSCCTCVVRSVNDRLREVFSWQQIDFVFPDQETRRAAIESGAYVQANNLPLGLEVWRDKLFITVPRWKAGVASTLNYVPLGNVQTDGSGRQQQQQSRSPRLVPYPSYEMNRLPGRGQRAADHIVNTFRLNVDACDRLWAIDMAAANGTTYGDPQLLIIDLNTDRVVRRYAVTANLRLADGSTWFPGLLVDVDPARCDNAYAYLPDIGSGMVVYNYRANTAWRLDHHFFHFDPVATVFNIGGVRLEWSDGVFGLALSPLRQSRNGNANRTLYFHAMASTRLFSVDTSALKSNRTDAFYEYQHLGHRSAGMQAASMASDPVTGVLFYALVNRDAVGCWNPDRHDRHSNDTAAVVASDPVGLLFPADVKVDSESNLWVLSDRMPVHRFQVNRFDVSDVNYRVFRAPVSEAIRGTVCEPLMQPGSGRPTQQTSGRPTQQSGGRPTQQNGGRPTQQGGGRPTQQGGGRPTQQGGSTGWGNNGNGGDNDNRNNNGDDSGDSGRPVWSQSTQQQQSSGENGAAWNTPNQRSEFDF